MSDLSDLSPIYATTIERTREILAAPPVLDERELATRFGELGWLADALCVAVEDLADPAGAGARLLARIADLQAKLDALTGAG